MTHCFPVSFPWEFFASWLNVCVSFSLQVSWESNFSLLKVTVRSDEGRAFASDLRSLKAYSHQRRINSCMNWANNLLWIHPQKTIFWFLKNWGMNWNLGVDTPIRNSALVQLVDEFINCQFVSGVNRPWRLKNKATSIGWTGHIRIKLSIRRITNSCCC